MRVCLLVPVLDAFKGGNHLPLLAAMRDIQFTILTNRTKPKNPDLPPNVKIQIVPGRLGSYYYGFSDYLYARAVLKQFPASDSFWQQFDVIHLNQTMGPALLKLSETGVPLCFFIHHPVTADLQVATEESSLFGKILWKLKYAALVSWQRKFCRQLPTIVTVSQTVAQRLVEDYDCAPSQIRVVPNGIDTTEFTPGNLSSSEFDVIALGSFVHPRKGFRYLARVYQDLTKKGLKVADVGRRSDSQRRILDSITGVRQFGTIEQEELVSLVQKSNTLISTSLYEGFGLSLIEALACGRPAFAFDAGAVHEVLEPIDSSLVVPLRDTQLLVARITEFLSLPTAVRSEKGREYREKVSSLYPLERSATALKAVYSSIKR